MMKLEYQSMSRHGWILVLVCLAALWAPWPALAAPTPARVFSVRDHGAAGRLVLKNVRLACTQPSPLPVIKTEGVNRLELDGVTYPKAAQPKAALALSTATQVRN